MHLNSTLSQRSMNLNYKLTIPARTHKAMHSLNLRLLVTSLSLTLVRLKVQSLHHQKTLTRACFLDFHMGRTDLHLVNLRRRTRLLRNKISLLKCPALIPHQTMMMTMNPRMTHRPPSSSLKMTKTSCSRNQSSTYRCSRSSRKK
jgi:hypothetical protein